MMLIERPLSQLAGTQSIGKDHLLTTGAGSDSSSFWWSRDKFLRVRLPQKQNSEGE
jgi:hypothetical protein